MAVNQNFILALSIVEAVAIVYLLYRNNVISSFISTTTLTIDKVVVQSIYVGDNYFCLLDNADRQITVKNVSNEIKEKNIDIQPEQDEESLKLNSDVEESITEDDKSLKLNPDVEESITEDDETEIKDDPNIINSDKPIELDEELKVSKESEIPDEAGKDVKSTKYLHLIVDTGYAIDTDIFVINNESSSLTYSNGLLTLGKDISGDSINVTGNVIAGLFKISSTYGTCDIGPQNASAMHLMTDRPYFYFNKGILIDGEINSYDTNDLKLGTGTNTRIFVSNETGNVSLTSDAPEFKLDLGKSATSTASDYIRFGCNGTIGAVSGGIVWKPRYGTYTKKVASIEAICEGNYFATGIRFNVNNTSNVSTNAIEAMRLTSDGKLAIGKTSALYSLDVNGDGCMQNVRVYNSYGTCDVGAQNASALHIMTDRPYFYFNKSLLVNGDFCAYSGNDIVLKTNTTSRLFINKDTGYTGIGTSVPVEFLDVAGNVKGKIIKSSTDYGSLEIGSVNTDFCHFITDRTQYYFNKSLCIDGSIYSYNVNNLNLGTYGSNPKITIQYSTGFVGINNTDPAYQLDIIGAFKASSILTSSSISAGTTLNCDGNASVGGTLTVTGNATFNSGVSFGTSIGGVVPIGTVMIWSYTAVSDYHYHLCDGTAISRATYSTLYAIIGVTYGFGDGITTFNLPNLKGRVIVGVDADDSTFAGINYIGGEKTHQLTIDEMPEHYHDATPSWLNGSAPGLSGSSAGTPAENGITGSNGGDQAHNNLQPYITMNYIIRVL